MPGLPFGLILNDMEIVKKKYLSFFGNYINRNKNTIASDRLGFKPLREAAEGKSLVLV